MEKNKKEAFLWGFICEESQNFESNNIQNKPKFKQTKTIKRKMEIKQYKSS